MKSKFEIFNNADNHISIIDSPMGTGKTEMAIQYINQSTPEQKFIVITPYLKEVERFINSCPDKNFVEPDARIGQGRKLTHFLELIRDEKNIVSTHSLFSNISDEIVHALQSVNYTLILDEVFDVVDKFDLFPEIGKHINKEDITRKDIFTLLEKDFISVEEDFRVTWNSDDYILSKYEPLRRLAERELLYLVNNTFLLWSFPVEVFRLGVFDKIFILTFKFEYQLQSHYYSYYDIVYKKFWINPNDDYSINETLVGNPHETEWINSIRPLISICDEKRLNRIGSLIMDVNNNVLKTSLSKTWYDKNVQLHRKLGNNMANFARHYAQSESTNDIMWTAFSEHKKSIKSTNGISAKNFVALNARATNEYGHKSVLLYPVNRYVNPFFVHFFRKRDIEVNEDGFALSEMLQWIWRSRIRKNKTIDIYIPSQRMRILLEQFLNNEEIGI